MRAAVFYEHGGPENLKYVEDFPEPSINPDEVLIKVNSCALNHLDLFVRAGLPGLNLPLPHVLGSDVSGTIEKVGENVSSVSVGNRVVVNPGIWDGTCEFCLKGEHSLCKKFHILGEHIPGGYAEFIKINACNCLILPENFPFNKAAAGSLVFLTAWRMLKTQAKLKVGEDILILGAGGGVSTAAIQIAKYLGANVIATTSSEFKMNEATKLGADKVFNYKSDSEWPKSVYKYTEKKGVDVVLDSVGSATWKYSLRSLKNGGRLVTCGATTGPAGETDIRLVFWRQIHIIGSTMATHEEFKEVMNLIFEGKLNPIISKEFPLSEASKAHEYLANMEQFGKVVLKIE
ncbi:MAG: zinc-binding dehydrogenase [Candidatus Kariarchaeaceae archaeon]|jgi:NADPH:quinone reductase-like Zn-dependent oxidoreductase